MKYVAPDITKAYVIKGFWQKVTPAAASSVCEEAGEIGLMEELLHLANLVEKVYQEKGKDFRSVWDYEVSEEFGVWLAAYVVKHKDIPEEGECLRFLEVYVASLMNV